MQEDWDVSPGKVKFSKIINVCIYKQKKRQSQPPFHAGFQCLAVITVVGHGQWGVIAARWVELGRIYPPSGSCVRLSSGGCSLAFSLGLWSVPFSQGWNCLLLPGQQGTGFLFAGTLTPCSSKAEARQRGILRLLLSPPGVILKQYRSFLSVLWFFSCLFGEYFITVTMGRHCMSARKRRTSVPLTFLWSHGGFLVGCFMMQRLVHVANAGKAPTQKPRNPANTDPHGGTESTASSNVKVKHKIILPAAGWGNTNPAFCHHKSQHSREKLPQAGGPYPSLSYYKCSNLAVSAAAATRPSYPCLWFTWASSRHLLCCKTSCSPKHRFIYKGENKIKVKTWSNPVLLLNWNAEKSDKIKNNRGGD